MQDEPAASFSRQRLWAFGWAIRTQGEIGRTVSLRGDQQEAIAFSSQLSAPFRHFRLACGHDLRDDSWCKETP